MEDPPNAVSIRRGEDQDIPRIVDLWLELARNHESVDDRFLLKPNPEQTYREQITELLANPEVACFVAVDCGQVVGYTLVMIWTNPEFFALDRYGFVAEISVSPSAREKGIGKLLWERSRRWFARKGVSVVQLNVSPKNQAGMKFWSNAGFDEFLKILWIDLEKGPSE